MSTDTLDHPAETRCLSAADLFAITGFRSPSRQCQWVRDHLGLQPAPRADGRPSITWAVYERARLGTAAATPPDHSADEAPPNWKR